MDKKYLVIKEATNGFVINAWDSKNNEQLVVCETQDDAAHEAEIIFKFLQ